jgi:ribosomal protein S18 acetylase RimI-like enzyme
MELRRAREEDVPLLARMLRASYDAMPYIPRLHTPEEDRRYVGDLTAQNEGWVADEDGRVLGFAVVSDDELLQIHVRAESQNRGIGTTLFRHATERRPRGFTLWTFQKNEGARRFYERHGCRIAQLTDGERNEEQEPDMQYVWRPT